MKVHVFLSKISSCFSKLDKQSFRREFRHAFSIATSQNNKTLNEQEVAIIQRLAAVIQKRRLIIPSTLFLECAQPLNYIGSQMMVFFRPFLTFFFTPAEYDLLQGILEKRDGIERIIEELEKRG
ncbi:MAG: hypothetical protein HRU72_01115 [Planctomycetia bacterium]|uniref:Uncharacterized protein n=1 Tax=Candidatus Brocadia sapporoensis TaxID=392547 RepID=A0A1V6M2H7_9BACT|nr:hypothetical protein [Candidatus Brocadia sapporoensis]MCC7239186.1 hypothetical protein [Candidatus Brocadia sp.]QOJ05255.1 MAG: hypothetical protein HRU72_01115 [Planctomycetia bacterium]TVL97350.1 MAG: hypothetical protein CV082_04265 [Candidatus Brocadia sp. BL1]MDG6005202.1 hypothetical protein [Candidatus Brocadia sp.]OQD46585.1 hypothetical protein BIY37_02495 [Candidatus Brocadia sapporoensis]